jgi:hypothetical protein
VLGAVAVARSDEISGDRIAWICREWAQSGACARDQFVVSTDAHSTRAAQLRFGVHGAARLDSRGSAQRPRSRTIHGRGQAGRVGRSALSGAMDPRKKLVRDCYDRSPASGNLRMVGGRWIIPTTASASGVVRALRRGVAARARVLDLGCGNGEPLLAGC